MSAPETIQARNGFSRLAERLSELGARRILVITARSRRFVDRIAGAFGAFEQVVFDGARVHVPIEVVEGAAKVLAESGADTLLAVGGGSAIGLAKALRLTHDVRFAAIPTTYSGSEQTSIHGVTRGGEKITGRDPRVRPDLILYDATLGASLSVGLTIQSLMNALAHPLSALSTGSLAGEDRARAVVAAATLVGVMEDLLLAPKHLGARETAMRAAATAAEALDRGKGGAQHTVAHLLGGALGLDHGPLHAVLLPQFVAHVRERDPALVEEVERAIGRPDLEPQLHDLLSRAGAPTSLEALHADPAAVRALLAARPELPAALVLDALEGLRPTGRAGRIALGEEPLALLDGPRPERARRIVVALHGRGAEAGGIVRRYREIAGHDPQTSVIGLRAGETRWYGVRASDPGAGSHAEVARALARVDEALAALARPVILAGFSQGSCLALEYAARRGKERLAAVVAPCGVRIGHPSDFTAPPPDHLGGVPVLLGAASSDPWVPPAHLEATAAWFRDAGAAVDVIGIPGDRHDIGARQRLRARELVLGRPSAPGGTGFGNALSSEAIPGALPVRQNNPRRPPFGLYAEQLSGTGFTARRAENLRTWCYRIRPSTHRRAYTALAHPRFSSDFEWRPPVIDLIGFAPLPPPPEPRDFVDGMITVGGAGNAALRRGFAVHLYHADRDMERRAFTNGDGDLLILPEAGAITLLTELGPLDVAPGRIAIVPRGVAFSVLLHAPTARGYVAEAFGRHFQLPERGPVGANGLADPRHFHAPAAWYEDKLAPGFRITAKLGGRLHDATQDHSPFDVVAWHGNHVPFVYDLEDFSPVGNVLHDHGDPSVHTVLSAPMDEQGAHTLDLVAFVPRWDVSEGTFRPPYFHRNAVTEVNGIIREEAPPGSPFQPGCCFVTPPMTPHGVSGTTVARVRSLGDEAADPPWRGAGSIWFQLECALPLSLTSWGEGARIADWAATWGSHRSFFDPGQ